MFQAVPRKMLTDPTVKALKPAQPSQRHEIMDAAYETWMAEAVVADAPGRCFPLEFLRTVQMTCIHLETGWCSVGEANRFPNV
jgi:hypothetical protein